MKKYNILYLHSHDTGRYIQPMGHAVETPHLQKLAEEGVLFRKAFTSNPTCSPSRACLLTGQYAHANGMYGLAHRGFGMDDYSKHIVNFLKPHGYTSALSGIQHIVAPHNEDTIKEVIGYDHVSTDPTMDPQVAAIDFLKNHDKEAPFFLSVGFFQTHRKFPTAHPLDDTRYTMPPAPLPDTPEVREDMTRFKQSARELDWRIGNILAELEELGLKENTIVICTTDHGIAFPKMKCNLTDHGTGVFLIMRGPERLTGGKVVDGMVDQIDIFPSLCEVLDVEAPDYLQGASFMPMVNGKAESTRDELFSSVNFHAAKEVKRAVRTNEWRYMKYYQNYGKTVMPNCDAGLSKDTLLEFNWKDLKVEDEYLFNVIQDPNETNNLIDDQQYAPVLEEMKAKLAKIQKDTGDPLLEADDIIKPKAAYVNDVSESNPS